MTTSEPLIDDPTRTRTGLIGSDLEGSITDGRTMRRQRNRDAVIESLITLIQDGELTPTVAKIADRAGVSHRSIFRYFEDLNDLARTAIETEFRNAAALATIEHPGDGTLEHRIETTISKQLATFEQMHQLGRVARGRMIDIPEIDRQLSGIIQFRLDQLREQFAPELDAMDEGRRDAILTAMAMAVGFDSYDMHRRTLERTRDEIARNWRTTMHALLA